MHRLCQASESDLTRAVDDGTVQGVPAPGMSGGAIAAPVVCCSGSSLAGDAPNRVASFTAAVSHVGSRRHRDDQAFEQALAFWGAQIKLGDGATESIGWGCSTSNQPSRRHRTARICPTRLAVFILY